MKRILVTGATGFIGNYVVAELLQQGYDVIATSSSLSKAKNASWYSSVTYFELNLKEVNQEIDYYRFFGSPDALIHLAWEGLPNYKDDFHVQENLPRHYLFLENLISNGLKNVTVTGTCLEYGMQEGCLTEELECKPENSYAIAKNELRKRLEALSKEKKIEFKWARLFYMYGKGQNPKSLIAQLDKALEMGDAIFNMSGGEQERDFLPIEKIAGNIVAIALQNNITGIVNCCSGKPVKVKVLVQEYMERCDKYIKLNLGYYPYTDYEPMRFWGSNKKLKKIINDKMSIDRQ